MTIEEWVGGLYGYMEGINQEGLAVRASARGQGHIQLDDVQPPPGVTISLLDVGAGVSSVSVVLGRTGVAPDVVELHLHHELVTLTLNGTAGSFGQVHVIAPEQTPRFSQINIESTNHPTDELHLSGGTRPFALKPAHAPDHLYLHDAALSSESQGEYPYVAVDGTSALPPGVRVKKLVIHPGSSLQVTSDTQIDAIESANDQPLDFKLRGTLLYELPTKSRVTLSNAAWEIQNHQAVNDVEIRGVGTVRVGGAISDSRFSDDVESSLRLELAGAAKGISGAVALTTRHGAVLIGSYDDPVRVRKIETIERSEIENVSLYELQTLTNLGELENAARFSLWLDRRWWRARRRASKMTFGEGAKRTQQQQRAHFWARLVTILEKSHASGRVQSAARANAMRFRRRAINFGVERSLLRIYSVVGYGESILRPLAIIVLLAAFFALEIVQPPISWTWVFSDDWVKSPSAVMNSCCPRLADYRDTAVTLLLSPLAFFKSPIKPPPVYGPMETFLLVSFQVMALLMLFFALSAIRRITKAE